VEYFDYGAAQAFDTGFNVEEFLEESQKHEQELLEKELERIDELLEEREMIHEDAVSELESKLDWYIERIEDLYRTPGQSEHKKEELKEQIKEFYQSLREVKVRKWRDKQELEKERRQMLREFEELEDGLLDKIL